MTRRTQLCGFILVGATICVTALITPEIRHAHEGDLDHHHSGDSHATHTHEHAHSEGSHHHHHGDTRADESHSHSHADPAPRVAHREGWHIHVNFLGFEITLWESDSHETDADSEWTKRRGPVPRGPGPVVAVTGSGPLHQYWSAPSLVSRVPIELIIPEGAADPGHLSGLSQPVDFGPERAESIAYPPPTPPPERTPS